MLQAATGLLRDIRRAKTDAGRSQRAAVAELVVRAGPDDLDALSTVADDLRQAGSVADLRLEPVGDAGDAGVTVVLGDD